MTVQANQSPECTLIQAVTAKQHRCITHAKHHRCITHAKHRRCITHAKHHHVCRQRRHTRGVKPLQQPLHQLRLVSSPLKQLQSRSSSPQLLLPQMLLHLHRRSQQCNKHSPPHSNHLRPMALLLHHQKQLLLPLRQQQELSLLLHQQRLKQRRQGPQPGASLHRPLLLVARLRTLPSSPQLLHSRLQLSLSKASHQHPQLSSRQKQSLLHSHSRPSRQHSNKLEHKQCLQQHPQQDKSSARNAQHLLSQNEYHGGRRLTMGQQQQGRDQPAASQMHGVSPRPNQPPPPRPQPKFSLRLKVSLKLRLSPNLHKDSLREMKSHQAVHRPPLLLSLPSPADKHHLPQSRLDRKTGRLNQRGQPWVRSPHQRKGLLSLSIIELRPGSSISSSSSSIVSSVGNHAGPCLLLQPLVTVHLLLPQPQGMHLHSSLSRTVLVKMQVGFDPVADVCSAFWAFCSEHLQHACCNPSLKSANGKVLPARQALLEACQPSRDRCCCQRHVSRVVDDFVQTADHATGNAAVCKGLPQTTQIVGL